MCAKFTNATAVSGEIVLAFRRGSLDDLGSVVDETSAGGLERFLELGCRGCDWLRERVDEIVP